MHRILITSALILLFGCEQKKTPSVPYSEPEAIVTEPILTETVVDTYQLSNAIWALGRKVAFEALEEANGLETAIQVLLSQPSAENLVAARKQWQVSLSAFYRAQPFLFIGIDNGPVAKNATVAHWPFYPGFIDSYGQYRDSGLVNAIDTPLNLSVVRQYHQQYEANELLLGFYPIAYLLWSEYEPRPVDDFTAVTSAPATLSNEAIKLTQLPQNRRRQLLRLQSEWLLIDIKTLYDAWDIKAADQSLLPEQRLRIITDSLLLSLKSILLQQGENSGLPGQFVQQHKTGMQTVLSNLQPYYFDVGLAKYWLNPEERILAQQWLMDLQDSETVVEDKKMQMLVELLSPDTPQTAVKDAVLNENVDVKGTP